jgi:diketogulonate reductase-like aldo/keto reductase
MERTISNESIDAIKYAIKIGYRGIDTASAYGENRIYI